ncbi:MFS transporter [Micromonospora sp. NPDC049801]|uniref:MFS transporter n=1 Tax=unclassified Micromonospora TaxID=2617518 RepID=UPI00340C9870
MTTSENSTRLQPAHPDVHGDPDEPQQNAPAQRATAARPGPRPALTLLALALGTFAIGTGEFGSNGILQLFAADLGASIPVATYAISAYAFGVMIGSPAITLLAARANRRTLLLGLITLFLVGNVLSGLAPNIATLVVFRFITGSVQGAFFGAGAVVAAYVYGPGKGGRAFATVMGGLTVATILGSPLGTLVGQQAGWRATYWTVVGLGLLAGAALLGWLPRTDDLHGGAVAHELAALRRREVWLMVAVAALGISSIFAVYTFIGPFVTDAARESTSLIPVALAVFGLGMAFGNYFGGRAADHDGRPGRSRATDRHGTADLRVQLRPRAARGHRARRPGDSDPHAGAVRRRRDHDVRHSRHPGTADPVRTRRADPDGRAQPGRPQPRQLARRDRRRRRPWRRLGNPLHGVGGIRPHQRRPGPLPHHRRSAPANRRGCGAPAMNTARGE